MLIFRFGKFSTVKHTVASVGLISFQQLTIYLEDNCTCDLPNVYINYHNTQT